MGLARRPHGARRARPSSYRSTREHDLLIDRVDDRPLLDAGVHRVADQQPRRTQVEDRLGGAGNELAPRVAVGHRERQAARVDDEVDVVVGLAGVGPPDRHDDLTGDGGVVDGTRRVPPLHQLVAGVESVLHGVLDHRDNGCRRGSDHGGLSSLATEVDEHGQREADGNRNCTGDAENLEHLEPLSSRSNRTLRVLRY